MQKPSSNLLISCAWIFALLPIATLFYTLYNIQSVAVFLLFELRPPPVHFYRLLALDAGVLVLVISRINHGARVRAQRILMN